MSRGSSENKHIDQVYFKDAKDMSELPDDSVQLIVTSPPYFNIKDYSKDGYQNKTTGVKAKGQIGDIADYSDYIAAMIPVWQECYRVLKPNGKMVINTPMMPMLKRVLDTHYNRHIFDIQ